MTTLTMGIDTSCDETSVAILRNESEILSNIISSQVKLHAPYGGVMPEMASRAHAENLPSVVNLALTTAGISLKDLTGVAVTNTPGLIGCLLVGLSYAKALSYSQKIPLTVVNHLKAHLFSPFLEHELQFPFLGAVLSGGHTALYLARDWQNVICLGQTVDDAMGEVFDKVAKLLGLGYPGGPIIDSLAQSGSDRAFSFTMARVKKGPLFMSYSGLKTAVAQMVPTLPASQVADLAASFQKAAVMQVMDRLRKALQEHEVVCVAISGGVAANSALRAATQKLAGEFGLKIFIPSFKLCTDNGAMIAYLGQRQIAENELAKLDVVAKPSSSFSGFFLDHHGQT